MSRTSTDALEAGRDALARHAWREAYDLLTAADAAEPLEPADLEGLSAAAWWTGRLEACISARERAFSGYTTAGDRRGAAIVAIALAKDYYAKLASSIGTAWVARAERLLADEAESVEHGYLERLLSVIDLRVGATSTPPSSTRGVRSRSACGSATASCKRSRSRIRVARSSRRERSRREWR